MTETAPPPAEPVAPPTPFDRLSAEVAELRRRLEQVAKGSRDLLSNLKGRMRNVEAEIDGMKRRWDDLYRILYEHSAASLRAERLADEIRRDFCTLIPRVHDLEAILADPTAPAPGAEGNGQAPPADPA